MVFMSGAVVPKVEHRVMVPENMGVGVRCSL